MIRTPTIGGRLWSWAIWLLVGFFIVNLFGLIATVVVNSFSTRWFTTWLPVGFTTKWYASAWDEFQLPDVLMATFEVVGAVVLARRPPVTENTTGILTDDATGDTIEGPVENASEGFGHEVGA